MAATRKDALQGAAQLAETGPTWQAMRLSRNRNWGHPVAIEFIHDLSTKAAQQTGWNGLYIGDISQPRGGPMLTGHASHQIGLDIDIWMRPANDLTLNERQREEISSTFNAPVRMVPMSTISGQNNTTISSKPPHLIHAPARIFVFPGAKVQMCKDETGDRAWLNKVRPWWGHHYHFHVRLSCPSGATNCKNQAPPPPGDGCKDAERWVRDILNPPPPESQCAKTQTKTASDAGAAAATMCWCFTVQLSGLVISSK
jgi:penicillin-insensitive murein endopeptidase